MDEDLRRATALTRELSRFGTVLGRHEANRFDIRATREVRRRVGDLFETLTFIGQDDRFWDRLSEKALVLDTQQISAFRWFDEAEFGAMLVACGYRSPPPPPVDELIGETRHALILALDAGARPELVRDARSSLLTLLLRTRRQMQIVDSMPVGSSTIAVVGRRLAMVARKILPAAVGAGVGGIAEAAFPGSGLATGAAVGTAVDKGLAKASAKAAEEAVKWGTAALMGHGADEPPAVRDSESWDELPTPDQAIAAHVATAATALSQLVTSPVSRNAGLAAGVAGHLSRAIELSRDHGGPSELESAGALALEAVLTVEARLADRGPVTVPGGHLDTNEVLRIAQEALDICLAARGQDSEFGAASYTSRPFQQRFYGFEDYQLQRKLSELWARWRSGSSAQASATQGQGGSTGQVIGAYSRAHEDDESEKRYYGYP